jgi:hypothetical protein
MDLVEAGLKRTWSRRVGWLEKKQRTDGRTDGWMDGPVTPGKSSSSWSSRRAIPRHGIFLRRSPPVGTEYIVCIRRIQKIDKEHSAMMNQRSLTCDTAWWLTVHNPLRKSQSGSKGLQSNRVTIRIASLDWGFKLFFNFLSQMRLSQMRIFFFFLLFRFSLTYLVTRKLLQLTTLDIIAIIPIFQNEKNEYIHIHWYFLIWKCDCDVQNGFWLLFCWPWHLKWWFWYLHDHDVKDVLVHFRGKYNFETF